MTTTTVIAGIGRLITNDPTHDTGLTGTLTDAWIAVSDGLIEAVGTGATPSADDGLDVAGRCVLPGFVDSHSHLVFAGNRSAEFAARMAGTFLFRCTIHSTIVNGVCQGMCGKIIVS